MNNAQTVTDAFDAIVSTIEQEVVKLRKFAAENLAQTAYGQTERIVSVADAALTLSKSTKTVLRYCKAGTLKPFKAKGANHITGVYLSSLNALLDS